MPRRFASADATLLAATLLVLLLCWKAALAVATREPPRARALLAQVSAAPNGSPTRIVLLASAEDTVAALALRAAAPGTPPITEARLWPGSAILSGAASSASGVLLRLVDAYGYSLQPLLLTFDEQGHVVRIRPLSNPPGSHREAHAGKRGTPR